MLWKVGCSIHWLRSSVSRVSSRWRAGREVAVLGVTVGVVLGYRLMDGRFKSPHTRMPLGCWRQALDIMAVASSVVSIAMSLVDR
jgi:hypothetical protein